MHRRYEDREKGLFAEFVYDMEEDSITILRGTIGDEGEEEVIDDAFETHNMPAEILFDVLCGELEEGFEEILPDNLHELVEAAHGVELQGRLRAFYETQEYKKYQGMICKGLDCRVNFVAFCVIGIFYEEFYDPGSDEWVELIPISSISVGDDYDYDDEQTWIGVDPSKSDGPVYQLFTSNAFEEAYENLDAFLADLRPE